MDNKENIESQECIDSEEVSHGTIVIDDLSQSQNTSQGSSQAVSILSDEMVREEEESEKTKHLNEERLRSLAKDDCYERLKFLLTNCVHYTSHLHRRMEEQRQELARAIELQRAQKAEKELKRKAKLASTLAKRKAANAETRSSTRIALQETSQRSSSRLQSQSSVVADSNNNNLGSKKRGRTRNSVEDAGLENRRKRAKLDEGNDSEEKLPACDSDKSKMTDTEDVEEQDGSSKNEEKSVDQPVLFTGGTLRKYQIEGFKWIQMLYENAINGILADEMGLGKTVQCIALICELMANGLDGPFLVCGPLSTLPNWVSEFSHFAPKVPTVLYHGNKTERLGLRHELRQLHEVKAGNCRVSVYPVVITSYEIAMNDRAYLSKFAWKLMIVDEGHRIKNANCRLIRELKMYNSTHRLLLTGTPLQNNMTELWSLLNFLIPEIFDNCGSFETWFDAEFLETVDNAHEQIIQEEQRKHTLSMLHQILQPFVLRRLKSDVDIVIPPKRELVVYARLVAEQQEMYRSIVDRTIRHLVEGPPVDDVIANAERDSKGRLMRQARKNAASLKFILADEADDEADSIADNELLDEVDDCLDTWAEKVAKYQEEARNSKKARNETEPKAVVHVQLRRLISMLQRCCNHPYLIKYPVDGDGQPKVDENLVLSCGKLLLLDRMLKDLIKNGHKVLIFCQMTMMMNVLEDYLSLREWGYSRLDGTMSMADRQEEMKRFREDKEVVIFLISTRAGGLGINLTEADTVIIYESDWNPQCDLQAQDRCHRIGQTRPVMVYRLVTANTVDQKIVERATAKRKLEKLVMHKGKFNSSKTLVSELLPVNPQELLEVLQETGYTEVAKETSESIISDKELKQLLDRSDLGKLWNLRLEGKTETTKSSGVDREVKGLFKVVSDEWDEPTVKTVGVAKPE